MFIQREYYVCQFQYNIETASSLEDKIIENIFNKFLKIKNKWFEFIDISFLPDDMKENYKTIISERLELLKQ